MAYTRIWNLNTPTDADPAPSIDDLIRNLKADLTERINTILGVPIDTAFADPIISFYDAGNSGTSKQIDWLNGPVQKVTMTGNCTFTFVNPIAGRPYVLIMVQGAGSHSVSLTGWDFGDGAFVPNTAAGRKNVATGLWDGTEYIAGQFATGA